MQIIIVKSSFRYVAVLISAGLCLGLLVWLRNADEFATESQEGRSETDPKLRSSRDWNGSSSPFSFGRALITTEDGAIADGNPTPIYGRNGRSVDFGGLPVVAYISKWVGLARAGDIDAAYNVYQAESVCSNVAEPLTEFNREADREQSVAEHKRLITLCAGVTPAQIQERLSFLSLAAHAGKVDAQIDYFMEGPYGRPIDLKESRDDPLVQTWKSEAVTGLKAAAVMGEPFAFALLSQSYDVGEIVPRDAKQSLAYKVAEAEVRNTTLSELQLRRKFGSQMSDEDFDAAMQMGKKLAQECCKK
ncbi:hypothetical protein ACO0K3_02830 [Undibacterium sp. Rencai35W]|uniref:hypothetical protein n=1 Tax=Undibacterium sp. Rencai35W TaxID=3413046 RepID=UPI003BEFBCA3